MPEDAALLRRHAAHRRGASSMMALREDDKAGETIAGSVQTFDNKDMPALSTTADGALACASGLAHTPAGAVTIEINGVSARLGTDCYFSNNNGASQRAIGQSQEGDTLHWRGSVAGFELAATDVISFLYEV